MSYKHIISRIDDFDPLGYEHTRNFEDGGISGLSPYLSRGVISTKQLYLRLATRYGEPACSGFLKQLLWREYFQQRQVGGLLTAAPHPDTNRTRGVPVAVLRGVTGIEAIDGGIRKLYAGGYMHNHVRLYTAAVCGLAGYRIEMPSQWMYYHLFDGDIASNTGSWQWAAGMLTAKRYIANQDNINHYCRTSQSGTFLDMDYDALDRLAGIDALNECTEIAFSTVLPVTPLPKLDSRPVVLYTNYNLDPLWHCDGDFNRVLLLDSDHYRSYPVSEKVLEFTLGLAINIDGLQVYAGRYSDLRAAYPENRFIVREHPLFSYPGTEIEPREWLAGRVNNAAGSFTKYFKAIQNEYHGRFI
ncbi:FAD-binding domain-containing protein [Flavobacterium album]|uniref:FAD-binding domain-containing protein n=1 Tax=Flavobacterium album TaxID=2175091 RepID=UPI0015E80B2A|nr:FAD-binding domain-containing protein [Flavobacterium album]